MTLSLNQSPRLNITFDTYRISEVSQERIDSSIRFLEIWLSVLRSSPGRKEMESVTLEMKEEKDKC